MILTLGAALLVGCATGPRFDARHPAVGLPASATNRAATNLAVTNLTTATLTNELDPTLLEPLTNFFTLGPGDRVEIELIGDPSTRATALVGPDGKLYYYLLPGLEVWGLTLGQTKALLEQELQKYIRDQPRVSLTLRTIESKQVWLLGRLNAPGIYPMNGPMTLLEAISLAGGPVSSRPYASLTGGALSSGTSATVEELADLHRGFVIRHGKFLPVDFYRLLHDGDLSQNIYLLPDDFVYLPSAVSQNVFVLGAVGEPRSVTYLPRMTLTAAIANAGGTIKYAYLGHVAIVRGSLTRPRIAVVDYRAIVHGRQPDVLLQPHDIVYVPFAPYRTLLRYADLILTTFVQTVGVNEGASAVTRGASPVGTFLPIAP
ncbi:MAG: SLBB domain-containing protein [Verrucomicrobia bacterium]|nr:SLBB domain-containing protein [Verrucomicrobiota bacterium]